MIDETTIRAARAPQTLPAKAPITFVPTPGFQRIERIATLFITIVPFAALCTAIPLLWNRGVSWLDLGLFLGIYVVSGLGTTAGFHRLFTHRSFQTKPWVRAFFAIAGSFAVEGSIIRWVADHRRHHAFADKDGDPHSPHLADGEGLKGVLSGLWHAHIGWFFDPQTTNVERFAPDMLKDPVIVKVNRLTALWYVLSFTLPAMIGFVVTGTLFGAFTALIWGSFVRIFFLHHITWSINSICHFYGKRPFNSSDFSTNNRIMSLLAFGEGWHNNHHAFPSSAIHGLEKGQIDFSGLLIKGLERVGLAWDVKTPSQMEIERKRVS